MNSVADIIRERGNRLLANAEAARAAQGYGSSFRCRLIRLAGKIERARRAARAGRCQAK